MLKIFSIVTPPLSMQRRNIRLIEDNAKCRHIKELTCEGTLRQVSICPSPRTPYLLCILYTYPHREGGGGEELNHSEGQRGNISQSWIENTNTRLHLLSINSDNTCHKVSLRFNFFRCFGVYIANQSMVHLSFLKSVLGRVGNGIPRSEKIPWNSLGMVSVTPRKKVLIPRHSEVQRRVNSEARNANKQEKSV